jgi:LPXTG-site transpeptidase (sortase) family protein
VTESGPKRRRRHRRSSPLRRAARVLGVDRSRPRLVLLLAAVALAVVAAVVALGGGSGPGTGPSPSPPLASPGVPSPSSTAPGPTATLPAVPTATPLESPSGRPEGIVARRIRIERLGIDLQVVEGDGLDAPLRKAAHYPGTGWPDGGTNIYIYGHAQEGMFLSLWDARVGDEVVLELKDGTSRRYLVTEVKPRVPWNALEYLEPTPTEQLTLQTSTSYTPTAPRFIVIAEPAP